MTGPKRKRNLFGQDSQSGYGGDGKGKIILKIGKLARRAVEARKPTNQDIDGETSESSTTDADGAHLEELFSAVVQACDSDGRPLHEALQLLPSKKRYPTYYDLIEVPIDLKLIAMKIQVGIYAVMSVGEYGALNELEKDLLLMCRNACSFNEPGSQIYKDAKTLKKIVASKRLDIEHGRTGNHGLTPGKTSERIRNKRLRSGLSHAAMIAALQYKDEEEDDEDVEAEVEDVQQDDDMDEEDDDAKEMDMGSSPMWNLYDSVANTPTSDPFRRLPSRRYYPDYYKKIRNPISLSEIRMRIKRGEYVNLTQLQKDINLMFENFFQCNTSPTSPGFQAADELQKIMQNKVQELLGSDKDSSGDDSLVVAKAGQNNGVESTHGGLIESDSDTNPGTGSNNSLFTNEASPNMYTPVASKSPSNWKKGVKSKMGSDSTPLNTTPGPGFRKGKVSVTATASKNPAAKKPAKPAAGPKVKTPKVGKPPPRKVKLAKERWPCPVCPSSFTAHTNMRRHVRQAHTKTLASTPKAFPCTACGAIFGRSDQLKDHQVVHTGSKPYVCGTCGRDFPQRRGLRVHHCGMAPRKKNIKKSKPLTQHTKVAGQEDEDDAHDVQIGGQHIQIDNEKSTTKTKACFVVLNQINVDHGSSSSSEEEEEEEEEEKMIFDQQLPFALDVEVLSESVPDTPQPKDSLTKHFNKSVAKSTELESLPVPPITDPAKSSFLPHHGVRSNVAFWMLPVIPAPFHIHPRQPISTASDLKTTTAAATSFINNCITKYELFHKYIII